MFTGLSLDQAPPFKAPLKFFLSAPIFAVLACLSLLFSNNIELHSPAFISSIHLLTIGYIIVVIFGALLQMLPVVAGAIMPKPLLVANTTYVFLILGLLSFSYAFFFYEKIAFFISATFLIIALLLFSSIALYKLLQVQKKSYIVLGMIFSLIFFILAFLLGIHLLISHATGNISELHLVFTSLHYNFIFFGFVFTLIVAITFQVVPMFWVASAFSDKSQRVIIFTIVGLLVFFTINQFLQLGFDIIYKIAMIIISLYFAIITIKKLKNRKRKLQDFTVNFFLTSIISLILALVYWLMMEFLELSFIPLGVLFGIGFIISLMNGMLYKIIPFLSWFHLSSRGVFDMPTMRDMIPQKMQAIQFKIHIVSLVMMFFAFNLDIIVFIKISILLFMVSNILLFINIYKVAKFFKEKDANITANSQTN